MLENILMTLEIDPPRLVLFLRTVSIIQVTRRLEYLLEYHYVFQVPIPMSLSETQKDKLRFFSFLCRLHTLNSPGQKLRTFDCLFDLAKLFVEF